MRKIGDVDKIVVHCSASRFGNVKIIRDWHVNGNKWDDIGYHYVILNGYKRAGVKYNKKDDGKIEEGRSLEYAGAHVRGYNSNSIGVCLIGNKHFTPKQLLESLPKLLGELSIKYNIPLSNVYGHYSFTDQKTCPNIDIEVYKEIVLNQEGRDEDG